MTQDQFAAATGVPKRTLARIELDDGVPSDYVLQMLGQALDALGVELIHDGPVAVGIRVSGRPSVPRKPNRGRAAAREDGTAV